LKKKDLVNLMLGIQEISKILVYAKAGLVNCKSVTGDFDKLDAIAKVFASPDSFFAFLELHVLFNY
jgi:hypothetical protein